MMVPLRSSRVTAMVRASRMLWAEGIAVGIPECRFGCMALMVRASEPLGLGLDEGVPAWDQRTRTEAVQDYPEAMDAGNCASFGDHRVKRARPFAGDQEKLGSVSLP